MKARKKINSILISFLFVFSPVTYGQCLPTENDCKITTIQEQQYPKSLDMPPQLSENEFSKPAVIDQSEWEEQRSHMFIPKGTPTWGALARDSYLLGLDGVGVSDNWISRESAELVALSLCKKNGGKDCYIEQTYSNACLSITLSEKGSMHWSISITKNLAMQDAMQICSRKMQATCRLVYAACSYPA